MCCSIVKNDSSMFIGDNRYLSNPLWVEGPVVKVLVVEITILTRAQNRFKDVQTRESKSLIYCVKFVLVIMK